MAQKFQAGAKRKSGRPLVTYRVTHQLGPNLPMTLKQKLCFSISSNTTFVLMSTGGLVLPDVPPCTFYVPWTMETAIFILSMVVVWWYASRFWGFLCPLSLATSQRPKPALMRALIPVARMEWLARESTPAVSHRFLSKPATMCLPIGAFWYQLWFSESRLFIQCCNFFAIAFSKHMRFKAEMTCYFTLLMLQWLKA